MKSVLHMVVPGIWEAHEGMLDGIFHFVNPPGFISSYSFLADPC